MSTFQPHSTREQYLGTIVSCGIGDTLGMPVEGFEREQIQKYVGRVTDFMKPVIIRDAQGNKVTLDEIGQLGYYTEGLEKGEPTDDTIRLAALGEALAERGFDLFYVAEKQLQAYEQQIQPDGSVLGGFGMTTTLGFHNLQRGMSPLESGVIGGPGNAPAMMMASLGVYMDATGKYEEGLAFAEQVGRITHLDPRSLAGGVVQAHATYALLQGCSRREWIDSLVDICRKWEKPVTSEFPLHDKGNLLSRLEWVQQNMDVDADTAYAQLRSSSVCFSSHPFSLFMFQKYWDGDPIKCTEGLIETVNYGGDCDTTGAIYGALCGAKNGMVFPEGWVRELKGWGRLQEIGEQLWGVKRSRPPI